MTLNCHSLTSLKVHDKYFKNSGRYDVLVNRSRIGNKHGLWIVNMTSDLGWFRTVLDLGHKTFSSDISNVKTDIMLDSKRSYRKASMGFWLALCTLFLDDLELGTLRSSKLHVKYCENDDRCNGCVNGSRIRSDPCAINTHHELWSWMTLNCASLDNRVGNSVYWAVTRCTARSSSFRKSDCVRPQYICLRHIIIGKLKTRYRSIQTTCIRLASHATLAC